MWIFIRPAQCLQPRRAWAWRRIHRDLERLVALHDASAIAAVIVEPVACSMASLLRVICSGSPRSAPRVPNGVDWKHVSY